MKLKTYVARDPQEALAQVRKELGPEAVILSTQSRHFHNSKSSWATHRQVEVTAAVNQAAAPSSSIVIQPCPPNPAPSGLPIMQIREELEEMKSLLRQWLGVQGPPSWLASYGELNVLYKSLLRAGVQDHILLRWLDGVRSSLTNGNNQATKDLKELALGQLLEEIEVRNPWKHNPKGPRRWTFLGTTGVGKTTTIAKLAIQAAFLQKIRVGLISLDTIRLGGQEQLASYARVSDLPIATIQTRSDLVETLRKMSDIDLILIDTPGRNPCDPGLPMELSELFGGLPELEHHLVVSSTTKEGNLADAFQAFKVMPLVSCIVTKVDESKDIVGVFNQLCTRRVPLSYLTTGQKVPEDIELATRRRLAGLLLRPNFIQSEKG